MPRTVKHLLIGSTEAYSGKSATVLGIAFQLRASGFDIAYGKPIGTWLDEANGLGDPDVAFMAQTLNLPQERLRPPILSLTADTIEAQLGKNGDQSHLHQIDQYCQSQGEDLLLLEGPGSLDEGVLFNLSLPQMAEAVDAPVLLVARFHSALVVDALLSAKQRLGQRLVGVLINDVPTNQILAVETSVVPYLERHEVPVLALIPRTPLMRSISVREIVASLKAEVLCRPDRLDLMVESLSIGAMNVNSALRYFRQGNNMAVITGGDRTDIQLAALETSTQCLVLTGHLPPSAEILARATDLEVPILSVDCDTLMTVERIDQLFGQVRLHETVKVECVKQLMATHLDLTRLLSLLNLKLPVTTSQS
ncbi:MAG: phosphotransacetylase family protein [Cyanobacteria bacterium Co-bin13]|nr:phosphotransacetylase family protein [Cyanobacteria bacterium Co-bin13]